MCTKKEPNLILASRSPLRADILRAAGLDFTVFYPVSQEDPIEPGEIPTDYVQRNALHKALECLDSITDSGSGKIVLACDTIVVCKNEILGKPADEKDARRMLHLLNDSVHYVHTGLCMFRKDLHRNLYHLSVDSTCLRMDRLSDQTIENYIASGLWRGKAGAFGYQDENDWLHIESGSKSNVLGLPIKVFDTIYQKFLQIPKSPQIRTSRS